MDSPHSAHMLVLGSPTGTDHSLASRGTEGIEVYAKTNREKNFMKTANSMTSANRPNSMISPHSRHSKDSIESLSLRYHQGHLSILDQSQLPHREVWVDIKNHKDMIVAITSLQVRGAPLIGVAATLSLAQAVREGCDLCQWREIAQELRNSRPTAVNLSVAVDRMLERAKQSFTKESLEAAAIDFFNEDVGLCQRMAQNGCHLIPDGASILTHCNTGALATAGEGTALAVIREAHRQGKRIHVYVGETRPLLQGGRLTTWELQKSGIPHTLICDHTSASLMARGKIDLALVGADRIAKNGDFANKVGTYNIAVLCQYHDIPFYTVAPYTTLDGNCSTGSEIPIEERQPIEVHGMSLGKNSLSWVTEKTPVFNPAFDVTPHELVRAWVFDTKVVYAKDKDSQEWILVAVQGYLDLESLESISYLGHGSYLVRKSSMLSS